MINEFPKFIEELEKLGEQQVALNLSRGIWASERKKCAQDWLKRQSDYRRDAREEAMLSAAERASAAAENAASEARRANELASVANRHARNAWYAATVAAAAAVILSIITIIEYITNL